MTSAPPAVPTGGAPVPVLIVEDHALLAQTLGVALAAEGCDVHVPSLRGVAEVLEDVASVRSSVVLLDLDLGDQLGDGAALVPAMVARGAKVLVVSGSTDRLRIASALEGGAVGFVAKSESFPRLIATTLDVAAGRPVMDESERHALLGELRRARREQAERLSPFEALTPKESQVLSAIFHGATVESIARDWVVSEATVRSHVRGVLTKLGVSSQLAAVVKARAAGWTV